MPASYSTFFETSTQASAALIGLLFVSVSLAPARVFGTDATSEHQFLALSAFTALVNAFFLSFASLLPDPHVGIVAIVLSALALSQTLALLLLAPRWRLERRLVRGVTAFLISAGLYGYELTLGVKLAHEPADLGTLSQLLGLLLGAYALGLIRSWQLLGARRERSLTRQLRELLTRRASISPGPADATGDSGDPSPSEPSGGATPGN